LREGQEDVLLRVNPPAAPDVLPRLVLLLPLSLEAKGIFWIEVGSIEVDHDVPAEGLLPHWAVNDELVAAGREVSRIHEGVAFVVGSLVGCSNPLGQVDEGQVIRMIVETLIMEDQFPSLEILDALIHLHVLVIDNDLVDTFLDGDSLLLLADDLPRLADAQAGEEVCPHHP